MEQVDRTETEDKALRKRNKTHSSYRKWVIKVTLRKKNIFVVFTHAEYFENIFRNRFSDTPLSFCSWKELKFIVAFSQTLRSVPENSKRHALFLYVIVSQLAAIFGVAQLSTIRPRTRILACHWGNFVEFICVLARNIFCVTDLLWIVQKRKWRTE